MVFTNSPYFFYSRIEPIPYAMCRYMTSHGYLVLAKYRCSDERMQKRFSDESVVVYQAR
jgi:hypothetical protein